MENFGTVSELAGFIAQHYPVAERAAGVKISGVLATNGRRQALKVETDQGCFVVKISDPGRPEKVVQSDTGILTYLADYDFPAPRLLLTRHGEPYLPYEDCFLHVYSYVEGDHPRPSEAFVRQAGQVLARLHNLPFAGYGKESSYHPAGILAEVTGYLTQALNTDQAGLAADLLETVRAFPEMDALPRSLIHTDPYLVNWIQDRSGSLLLIDWDDAGVGIPLLDIGYGVVHLATYPRHEAVRWGVPVTGDITWRKEWSLVFLEGYQSVRPLSRLERELLPAAVDLSVLAYVWDWGSRRLIMDNVLRMQMVRELFTSP